MTTFQGLKGYVMIMITVIKGKINKSPSLLDGWYMILIWCFSDRHGECFIEHVAIAII